LLLRELPIPSLAGSVRAAAFSPDGGRIALVGDRGLYIFIDPWRRLRRVEVPTGGGRYRSIAFGPDGRSLAVGTVHGTVEIFRLR
jgi:WD40 repeat protein